MTAAALPLAAFVAVLATPLARRLAERFDVVDHPGPLKIHARPIPYLGGAAVLAGVLSGSFGVRPSLVLPIILAAALGLVDDVSDLSPRLRMAAEVCIGVVAAAVVPIGGPGVLLTVVVVVALINAVNLLDGMDGLASGVTLVSALGFAVVLDGQAQTLALAVAGAVAGFLVFNRPPASIYLGDSGAYALGTVLALLLLSTWTAGDSQHVAIAGLALVAVPVADTSVAVIRRLRAGQPLFAGDRGHIYDQLVDRGVAPIHATSICIGAQAVLAVGAVVTALVANSLTAACLVAVAGALGLALLAGGFISPNYARNER